METEKRIFAIIQCSKNIKTQNKFKSFSAYAIFSKKVIQFFDTKIFLNSEIFVYILYLYKLYNIYNIYKFILCFLYFLNIEFSFVLQCFHYCRSAFHIG